MSADAFTPEERAVLARHVTNVDGDVFALTDLPEVVKGALFARYSRSAKSLRRLLLDEFAAGVAAGDGRAQQVGVERAERLYERVFNEYGDDSVAQLGGAHVAVEHASNVLTKQLEWGRLAAYLEQSTRYVPYDDRPGGHYRYVRPPGLLEGPHGAAYVETMDAIFSLYAGLLPRVVDWVRRSHPRDGEVSEAVWRSATRSKALDILRGLLPAATTSNVGIFASGQAYEALLLRLRASDLPEARTCAEHLLVELRKVIPSFLTRVDRPDRGGRWSAYLAATRAETRALARDLLAGATPEPTAEVTLVDWAPADPAQAEVDLVTAMLYPHTDLPEQQLRRRVADLTPEDRRRVVAAYVGERANRRHKPGRAFERPWYRFDVLGDYGAFRDLQRHRMMTIEWQDLTVAHGYAVPEEVEEAGVAGVWHEVMERSAALHSRLVADHPAEAQYAVCFAYRVRYVIQINARAAMHLVELRSAPEGHPAYRRVAVAMHDLIRDVAGHTAVAAAMTHLHRDGQDLERLESERRAEARRGRVG